MKVRPLDLQESQDATGDYKHTIKGGSNNQQPHKQHSIPAISVIRDSPSTQSRVMDQGIYCSDIPG